MIDGILLQKIILLTSRYFTTYFHISGNLIQTGNTFFTSEGSLSGTLTIFLHSSQYRNPHQILPALLSQVELQTVKKEGQGRSRFTVHMPLRDPVQ